MQRRHRKRRTQRPSGSVIDADMRPLRGACLRQRLQIGWPVITPPPCEQAGVTGGNAPARKVCGEDSAFWRERLVDEPCPQRRGVWYDWASLNLLSRSCRSGSNRPKPNPRLEFAAPGLGVSAVCDPPESHVKKSEARHSGRPNRATGFRVLHGAGGAGASTLFRLLGRQRIEFQNKNSRELSNENSRQSLPHASAACPQKRENQK